MKSAPTAVMSVRSQIASMSGVSVDLTKAAALPVTQAGLFVRGDVKKGEAAHAFRMAIVETAIMEALKSNPRNLAEMAAESEGTSAICAGYQAGLSALAGLTRAACAADPADRVTDGRIHALYRLARDGKWDSKENAAIRDNAHVITAEAVIVFDTAFKSGIDAHKAAKAAARQAKADAKAAQEEANQAAIQAAQAASSAQADEPEMTAQQADLLVAAEQAAQARAAALVAVVDALKHGMLTPDELAELAVALAEAIPEETPEAVAA